MNIINQEEKALKELLYDESIIIRPSDKSSGIVILNRSNQRQKRESFWIRELQTLHPEGINKKA